MNYSEHVGSLSLYTVIAVRPLLAEKKISNTVLQVPVTLFVHIHLF